MRTITYSFITASIILTLVACHQSRENSVGFVGSPSSISETEDYKAENSTDDESDGEIIVTDANGITPANNNTSPNDFISSSAAVEDGKDTIHRFIRTADMQFKVKSVASATYRIEDIVRYFGGWVEYTDLSANVDYTTLIPVSQDSSLQTTYYTVKNSIQLRVPNTKLDTVLKSIAALIDFMDYRTIKAEDISLKFLAQNLEQKRLLEYDRRVKKAIDEKGSKLKEVSPAEDDLLRRQEQSDAARIAELGLLDRISFSAISLLIYQNKTTKRELIYNDRNIDEYKPSFGSRFIDSLKSGWNFVQEATLVIARIWWIFVPVIIVILIFRFLKRRKTAY